MPPSLGETVESAHLHNQDQEFCLTEGKRLLSEGFLSSVAKCRIVAAYFTALRAMYGLFP